jgi:small GTP-binding protein
MKKTTQRIPVVVLGARDHGKSTLISKLLLETASISHVRFAEAKKAAEVLGVTFELAHVLDSFRVERTKGMTIDTTRAIVNLGGRMYEFIDVPGHEELIKNRLTGASNATSGIWVIAANEGITHEAREHARLARFLRLEHLLVTINKMDAVDFSPERFEILSRDVQKLLKKIRVKYLTIIPVSALDGGNVLQKSVHLRWFKGPTIRHAIKNFRIASRPKAKEFIMAVQDVYGGSQIVGQVLKGTAAKGDTVRILPENRKGTIKRISFTGMGATLEIEQKASARIGRGDVITTSRKNLFKKKVVADCILLGPTGGKLTAEAHFRESIVRKLMVRQREGIFSEIELTFEDPLFIPDSFVLKKNQKIIAVCRTK